MSFSVENDPLSCPDGTTLKTIERNDGRVEKCVDEVGLREGPLRLYRSGRLISERTYHKDQENGISRTFDMNGSLLGTSTYDQGKLISSQLSAENIRKIFQRLNSENDAEGKHWRIGLIDEQTVSYDVTVGFPWSIFVPNENELRDTLVSNAKFCSIFKIENANFALIRARYVKPDGSTLVEVAIPAKDCANK